MVQKIEEVRAELQLQPFCDRKIFHQGPVPLEECGAPNGVAPHGSDHLAPLPVVGWFDGERVDVIARIRPMDVGKVHALTGHIVRPHGQSKEAAYELDVCGKP